MDNKGGVMKNKILHKKDTWWKPPHHCWNCGNESGYGKGIEPQRYDIAFCSSKCNQQFYTIPIGGKE